MNKRRKFVGAGVPTWLVILAMIQLLAGDGLAAEFQDSFRFIDPPVQRLNLGSTKPKTQIVVRKKWLESEKQRIITALEKIDNIVPGLIERTTAFGKVRLYRSSFAKGEGPLASANAFTNSMIFTDRFFELKQGFDELTVAHELTHLADPANVNELSAEWDRLVRPRCQRIHDKLSKDGIRLSYRSDWNHIEKTYGRYARKQGMPSVYACVNWTETLAEQVRSMYVGYQPPKKIKSFIIKNYVKSPYKPSAAIAAYQQAKSLHLMGKTAQAITAYSGLLSSHPELKIASYRRGMVRQRKRDFDGALADFDKAIEIFRGNERKRLVAGIYSRRASIFVQKQDYKAAVKAYGQALDFNPGWIEYRFERGKLLLEKTKEPRRAISDFTEILHYRPNSVPIYLARAKAWEQLKDFPQMDDDFAAAIKLKPDYAQSYYQRAFTYKDRGLCQPAIADFAQVIALKEITLLDKAYMNSAQCREALNDYRGAIADWTGLLQSVKRWSRQPVPDINAARGLAYFKVGQRTEAFLDLGLVLRLKGAYAIPTFTKMIVWKPNDPAGYVYRGHAYFAKRDYSQAIADFTKVIEILPRDVAAHIQRGKAYSAKKDYDRAFADFSKAIEIQPRNVTIYSLRGDVYISRRDYDRAIVDFTKVIEIQPQNVSAYLKRAKAHIAKKDIGRAVEDFTKVIDIQPKNITAYIQRGKAYADKKDYNRAIADFTMLIAIQHSPIQKINTYILRGKAYTEKQEYVRALADFDWVIGKYPKAWIAIADRARTYELQGNAKAAIKDLKEALRLKPKHEQLVQRLKALTSNAK